MPQIRPKLGQVRRNLGHNLLQSLADALQEEHPLRVLVIRAPVQAACEHGPALGVIRAYQFAALISHVELHIHGGLIAVPRKPEQRQAAKRQT